MFNTTTILALIFAVLLAVLGLMVGLDEPQNTPLEITSDLIKQGALSLFGLASLPELAKIFA